MVVVCIFDGVGCFVVWGEGENERAAMATGGMGHHGGLVMTGPALGRVVRPGGCGGGKAIPLD